MTARRIRLAACVLLLVESVALAGAEKKDTAVLTKGNTQFAIELYGRLADQKGNLFLSPYSISTALAMTYAGARGETAAQMAGTLHFELDPAQLHPAMKALLGEINGPGTKRDYELLVANALWGQKGYAFRKEFLGRLHDDYGAGFEQVDFVNATEAARQTINAWVEKQTRDKIKDLLKRGILTKLTRLVLTNAVYFKGKWAEEFDKKATADAPFMLADGKAVKAPMMNATRTTGYVETPEFQALELPYRGAELSMVIFLPRQADGLAEFEKSLTAAKLGEWLGALRRRHDIVVSLPRFKATSEFSLGDVLKAMGMEDAFGRKADFSGMNGNKDLYITAVVHKAYVDVNEEGTEAAAATGVIMGLKSVAEPLAFRADHPFLFLIRHRASGAILFMGRIADPR